MAIAPPSSSPLAFGKYRELRLFPTANVRTDATRQKSSLTKNCPPSIKKAKFWPPTGKFVVANQ